MNILDETLTIAESRDIKKAKAIQMELRDRVSLIDSFPSSPKKIFGVDLAYNGYTAFVSIVLWNNTSHEIEAVFNDFKKISFPYIPGFLSFREFPVFYMLYEKIQIKPDLVIFSTDTVMPIRGEWGSPHMREFF
ncbi:MAG: hypothetical protein GWP03_05715 [Proteobacteria bacterium]|nr:hypothetical protein [Pseudomonadota bacterium]